MIRFNLLPYRQGRAQERRRQFFLILAGSIALCAALLGGVSVWLQMQQNLQALRNERLAQEQVRLAAELSEVAQLEAEVAHLSQRIKLITSLDVDRALLSNILDQFQGTQPQEVSLTQFNLKQSTLDFSGKTSSNEKLSNWLLGLSRQAALQGVTLRMVKQELGPGNATASEPKLFSIVSRADKKGPSLTAGQESSGGSR